MAAVSSKVSKQGAVARSIEVSVGAEDVEAERRRLYAGLRGRVRVDGFRKGKAPDEVLRRRYGEQVDADVVQRLVEKACGEVLAAEKLDAVTPPVVVSHELNDAGLRFEATVEVRPEFKLRKYKGLRAVRRVVKVEDRHVAKYLDSLRERAAVLEAEEERVNVEAGDVVVADIHGFHEGKPVDEATGEGVQVEVGAGQLPEELDKQMVGVTRSIKTPILARFPQDYGNPDLAGRAVRFEVTVREIKRKLLPPLDDDLPAELGAEGCHSLDELKARLREDLKSRSAADADRRMRGELLDALVEAHDFEVPPGLVERHIIGRLRDMGVREIPRDRLEEVRSEMEPVAVKEVRARFLLETIAEGESIETGADEINEGIEKRASLAGERADELRRYYRDEAGRAELAGTIKREKALDLVVESATRRDEEIDETQVADTRG